MNKFIGAFRTHNELEAQSLPQVRVQLLFSRSSFAIQPSLRYGAALVLQARRSLESGGGLASKDRLSVAVLAIEDTPVNDGECTDLDTVAKTGKRF